MFDFNSFVVFSNSFASATFYSLSHLSMFVNKFFTFCKRFSSNCFSSLNFLNNSLLTSKSISDKKTIVNNFFDFFCKISYYLKKLISKLETSFHHFIYLFHCFRLYQTLKMFFNICLAFLFVRYKFPVF